jgi:trigger factor
MTAQLETLSQIRRALSIEVPKEVVDKAFGAAIQKINNEANIPGFRKGKIPEDVILKRFGRDVEIEAIKEAVRETYPAAVKEAGANPLSEPEVEPAGKIERGKSFSYKAIFEIYPEVAITDYTGLALTSRKVDIAKEEVEEELKRIQRQMTQLEPIEGGEIGPGMIAMIDFKGTAGGEAFPGSEAENYVVDFGSGALLSEFEVEIKGMKAADERDISFHYPTDFFRREIAGKKGEFRVKVKEVRRKVVPELNDAFAKELGNFENLDAVRIEVEKRMREYREGAVVNELREQAIRALIGKHQDLEVPTALIDSELSNMLEQLRRKLESQGKTMEDAKVDAHQFVRENVKEATDRARGFMLVREIMQKEKITLADTEVEERIARIAAESRANPEQVKEYFEKENRLEGLRSQALFEKTLDFVVGKANVQQEKAKKEK